MMPSSINISVEIGYGIMANGVGEREHSRNARDEFGTAFSSVLAELTLAG